jgi:hypothetical protein
MITIYKYPLQLVEAQLVKMPFDPKLLHFNFQHNDLFVWAEVDTDNEHNYLEINIVSTGGKVPVNGTYHSTIHKDGYVYHIYLC